MKLAVPGVPGWACCEWPGWELERRAAHCDSGSARSAAVSLSWGYSGSLSICTNDGVTCLPCPPCPSAGIQCVLPDALLLQLACAPPLTPQALHQAVEASRAPSSLLPPSSPTLEAALAHPLPSKEAPGATLGGPDAAVLPPAAAAAIPAAPAAAPCACFPGALLGDAPVVVELLREAVAGQRPWVSAELNALVQPGGQVKKQHQYARCA